jgi:hypothetical protein
VSAQDVIHAAIHQLFGPSRAEPTTPVDSTPPVVTEADAARLAVGDLGDGPPTKDFQRRWEAIERYVTQQAYRA